MMNRLVDGTGVKPETVNTDLDQHELQALREINTLSTSRHKVKILKTVFPEEKISVRFVLVILKG